MINQLATIEDLRDLYLNSPYQGREFRNGKLGLIEHQSY